MIDLIKLWFNCGSIVVQITVKDRFIMIFSHNWTAICDVFFFLASIGPNLLVTQGCHQKVWPKKETHSMTSAAMSSRKGSLTLRCGFGSWSTREIRPAATEPVGPGVSIISRVFKSLSILLHQSKTSDVVEFFHLNGFNTLALLQNLMGRFWRCESPWQRAVVHGGSDKSQLGVSIFPTDNSLINGEPFEATNRVSQPSNRWQATLPVSFSKKFDATWGRSGPRFAMVGSAGVWSRGVLLVMVGWSGGWLPWNFAETCPRAAGVEVPCL